MRTIDSIVFLRKSLGNLSSIFSDIVTSRYFLIQWQMVLLEKMTSSNLDYLVHPSVVSKQKKIFAVMTNFMQIARMEFGLWFMSCVVKRCQCYVWNREIVHLGSLSISIELLDFFFWKQRRCTNAKLKTQNHERDRISYEWCEREDSLGLSKRGL